MKSANAKTFVTSTTVVIPQTAIPNLDSVDCLRGLAAFAVCLFHFVKGFFPDTHLFREFTSYGWLGVESFFVISGFVIPLSMIRSRYRITCVGRFLAKRYLRLGPPYLASVVVVVALGYVSAATPGFKGEPFTLDWRQIGLHVLYLNDLFNVAWLNPVFWTLAIELQYYAAIAIGFSSLFSEQAGIRRFAFVITMLLGAVTWSHDYVFAWTYVFLTGVCVCHLVAGTCSRNESVLMLAAALAAVYLRNGQQIAFVSAITAIGTMTIKRVPASITWGGTVSYSLYLLHVPIGGRLINLSKRVVDSDIDRYLAVAPAMAVSLLSAYIFYLYVEVPSHKLSRRIAMHKPPPINVSQVNGNPA